MGVRDGIRSGRWTFPEGAVWPSYPCGALSTGFMAGGGREPSKRAGLGSFSALCLLRAPGLGKYKAPFPVPGYPVSSHELAGDACVLNKLPGHHPSWAPNAEIITTPAQVPQGTQLRRLTLTERNSMTAYVNYTTGCKGI